MSAIKEHNFCWGESLDGVRRQGESVQISGAELNNLSLGLLLLALRG